MPSKFRTEFFSKNLFYFIVVVSTAIHAVIILLSPQVNKTLNLYSLREDFVREPSEYAVTLEIENPDTQKKQALDTKQKEAEKEQAKEPEEKKQKIFTDTSDNKEDEESKVDTDKIGEKGAVARDNFPNDKQHINNEPHAEGRTKAPLLGKGSENSPVDKQQPQEQKTLEQAFVSENNPNNKNSPPMYSYLPRGLEKQQKPLNSSQKPQLTTANKETHEEHTQEEAKKVETVKFRGAVKEENTLQTPKRERLTIGRTIEQEESVPLIDQEGFLFTDKQNHIDKESDTEPALSEQYQEVVKEEEKKEKRDTKEERLTETKEVKTRENPHPLNPEVLAPLEFPDIEPQRELEKGLDEQESPGELKKPSVSFDVRTKKEGAGKEPVLFEDTISNASLPGMPSFNVKKHEYADYFKHIRDRISLYWFLGYGTRAEIKLETKGDKPIIIEFKVLPNGTIDKIKIVDDAGNFQLASRLISSIKNATPLNPFPAKIKEPSIDVRFNFYFF